MQTADEWMPSHGQSKGKVPLSALAMLLPPPSLWLAVVAESRAAWSACPACWRSTSALPPPAFTLASVEATSVCKASLRTSARRGLV